MTIEKLLECPLELENLSDAQIEKLFGHVLHITRPELAKKEEVKHQHVNHINKKAETMKKLEHIKNKYGISLEDVI